MAAFNIPGTLVAQVQAEPTSAVSTQTLEEADVAQEASDAVQEVQADGAADAADAAATVTVTASKGSEAGTEVVRVVDPEGAGWEWGAKASQEDNFAIKRTGEGKIESIDSFTADGREVEPEYVGFVNESGASYVVFSIEGLYQIPPEEVEVTLRTDVDKVGDYSIAESEEVPASEEVEWSGTVSPEDTEAAASAEAMNRNASAGSEQEWSDEFKLDTTALTGEFYNTTTGQKHGITTKASAGTLEGQVGKDIRITRVVIKNVQNNNWSPNQPLEIRKNNQWFDYRNAGVTYTDIKDSSGRKKGFEARLFNPVTGESAGPDLRIWSGADTLTFFTEKSTGTFRTDQNFNTRYVVEVYGSYIREDPLPADIYRCSAPVPRKAKHELTAEELSRGTTVFVSHSQGSTGGSTRSTTTLSRQLQGADSFEDLGTSQWAYNAIAYNRDDGWIYAVTQENEAFPDACPSGRLLQIDPVTGEAHNLGPISSSSGSSPWSSDGDRDLLNSGWFNYSTTGVPAYWVTNAATSGTRAPYRIQLPAVGSTAQPQVAEKAPASTVYSEDMATLFNPSNPKDTSLGRYSWGLMSPAGLQEKGYARSDLVIERWDSQTKTVTRFKIDNPLTLGGREVPNTKTWGKAWVYGNGNLGFGTGGQYASSAAIQVKVNNPTSANPTFEIVSVLDNMPVSYSTDGTSNAPLPISPVDLSMEKVALTEENQASYGNVLNALRAANGGATDHRYWALVIRNETNQNSSGFTVIDRMPNEFDPSTVKAYSAESGQNGTYVVTPNQPEPGMTSIEITSGPLGANQTRVFYLSAKLREGEQCVPNTAEVIGNELDENPDNNIDQDECPDPGLGLRVAKVDYDKMGETPQTGNFLQGAQFSIRSLDAGSDFDTVDLILDNEGFLALPEPNKLQAGRYELIERRSPAGYSLLVAPVTFRVNDVGENPRLVLDAGSAGLSEFVGLNETGDVAILKIGNVRTGNLPKTGGAGLGIYLAGSFILLLLGGLLARRRA